MTMTQDSLPSRTSYLLCHEDMMDALRALRSLTTIPDDLLTRLEEGLGQIDEYVRKSGDFHEHLVAKWAQGAVTSYDTSYDVLSQNGKRIEVKYSKLNSPNKSSALRWNWSNISGGPTGEKDFDYLLLLGHKDTQHESEYKLLDKRYVVFCIPRSEIQLLKTQLMNKGGRGSLGISTPPTNSRTQQLMKYMIDADDIERLFIKEKD